MNMSKLTKTDQKGAKNRPVGPQKQKHCKYNTFARWGSRNLKSTTNKVHSALAEDHPAKVLYLQHFCHFLDLLERRFGKPGMAKVARRGFWGTPMVPNWPPIRKKIKRLLDPVQGCLYFLVLPLSSQPRLRLFIGEETHGEG